MFDISTSADISVLHLYGEISLMEMDIIEKMITSFRKHRHYKILLDLAHVDHVHFQAVKRWAEAAKELQNFSGDLKLINPNSKTKNIIKFIGADQYLRDYASTSDAILSFLKSVAERSDLEILLEAEDGISKDSPQQKRRTREVSLH